MYTKFSSFFIYLFFFHFLIYAYQLVSTLVQIQARFLFLKIKDAHSSHKQKSYPEVRLSV